MDKEDIKALIAGLIGPIEDQLTGPTLRAAIELVFQPAQEKPGQDALSDGAKEIFAESLNLARVYASASPAYRATLSRIAKLARQDAESRFFLQFGGEQ